MDEETEDRVYEYVCRNNLINAARSSRDQENIFAGVLLEFSNVTILKVAVARQSSFVLKKPELVWI